MISESFEYISILGISIICLIALLPEVLNRLVKQTSFWLGLAIFMLLSIAIDYYAIKVQWWIFSENKIVGIFILKIPLEEYILFIVTYMYVVGLWEFKKDDLA